MSLTEDTYLTPNFQLKEFLGHGEPIPDGVVLKNLFHLASRLQQVRDALEKPIIITSGYRSPQHNQQVGGASKSYHMQGMAVDIQVPGMTPQEVQHFLADWPGGLGAYPAHTHVDIRPYRARWGASYK